LRGESSQLLLPLCAPSVPGPGGARGWRSHTTSTPQCRRGPAAAAWDARFGQPPPSASSFASGIVGRQDDVPAVPPAAVAVCPARGGRWARAAYTTSTSPLRTTSTCSGPSRLWTHDGTPAERVIVFERRRRRPSPTGRASRRRLPLRSAPQLETGAAAMLFDSASKTRASLSNCLPAGGVNPVSARVAGRATLHAEATSKRADSGATSTGCAMCSRSAAAAEVQLFGDCHEVSEFAACRGRAWPIPRGYRFPATKRVLERFDSNPGREWTHEPERTHESSSSAGNLRQSAWVVASGSGRTRVAIPDRGVTPSSPAWTRALAPTTRACPRRHRRPHRPCRHWSGLGRRHRRHRAPSCSPGGRVHLELAPLSRTSPPEVINTLSFRPGSSGR